MQIKKISLILLASTSAYADISLYDGAYRRQDTDSQTFERSYSSRRLERGHLGIGWCNALDNRLLIKQNRATLYDCSSPLPIEFVRIGQKYSAITGSTKSDTKNNPTEELRLHDNQWQRWQSNKHLETYTKDGKIIQIQMANDIWRAEYSKEKIILTSQKKQTQMNIHLHKETGFIQSLFTDKNEQIYFDYDQGYLVATRTKKHRLHSYVTSSSGDILKAMDGSFAKDIVFYDERTDRVLQIEKGNGCTFTVTYSENTPSVLHTCPRHLATK